MMSPWHKSFAAALGVAAIASMAGGCATEDGRYRTQRSAGNEPTARADQWRVCGEAAPEAFNAISAAVANFGPPVGNTEAEREARAAMTAAELTGGIERTQTINLLRESMYRTCERYLSGAIDRATFLVQAGRDWRAMIAILAIEELVLQQR